MRSMKLPCSFEELSPNEKLPRSSVINGYLFRRMGERCEQEIAGSGASYDLSKSVAAICAVNPHCQPFVRSRRESKGTWCDELRMESVSAVRRKTIQFLVTASDSFPSTIVADQYS